MSKNPTNKSDTIWSPAVKITALICALVLLASIALAVVAKVGVFRRNTVVMTVGESEINALEFNYGYYSALNDFYSQYYSYINYIGFNPSTSLKSQTCYFDSSMSWYDYFVSQTKIQYEEVYLLYNAAKAQNFQMTEESAKALEDSVAAIEEAAETEKISVNKYLQQMYGPNITLNDYKEFATRRMISADFYQDYMEKLGATYKDEDIEKYYSENKSTFDRVTYFEYEVQVPKDSNKTAEIIANELAAITDGTAFEEALKNAVNAVTADSYKKENFLKDNGTYTKDDETSEWLFNSERKAGDTKVFTETSKSSSDSAEKITYTVVSFVERSREEYQLATMRHILFTVEDKTDDNGNTVKDDDGNTVTNDAEQKAAAEKLLNDWKSGDATEDTFAALVKDNTDDEGSVENGGLYEDFDQDTMVDEITEWMWKEGRKAGDCEVVKTTYGYHIVYFVKYGDAKWKTDVTNTLKSNDYSDYLDELRTQYPKVFNDKGLSQVG